MSFAGHVFDMIAGLKANHELLLKDKRFELKKHFKKEKKLSDI